MYEGEVLLRTVKRKKQSRERRIRYFLALNICIFMFLGSVLAFAAEKSKLISSTIQEVNITVSTIDKPKYMDPYKTIKFEKQSVQVKNTNGKAGQSKERDSTIQELTITEEELDLFARLIEAEAGGETLHGKLAVATVVMNRLHSSRFPNSIAEVIMEKNQFSPVRDGRIKNIPSQDSEKVVEMVLEGYRSFTSQILYFCNPKIAADRWMIDNKDFVMKIGKHHFYR